MDRSHICEISTATVPLLEEVATYLGVTLGTAIDVAIMRFHRRILAQGDGKVVCVDFARDASDEAAGPGLLAAISETIAGPADTYEPPSEREARVLGFVETLFGDEMAALEWFDRPRDFAGGGHSVRNLCCTHEGAQRVCDWAVLTAIGVADEVGCGLIVPASTD